MFLTFLSDLLAGMCALFVILIVCLIVVTLDHNEAARGIAIVLGASWALGFLGRLVVESL